ncbi:MAG: PTS fructose transporter subunit IIA [Betaproteobacteria bacterium]|nr:PTS fructose transporter subunit IIA [Betaproteobacteria bacterium]
MVGILIVAHGTLGESLVNCATHVMGSRPTHLMHVGVQTSDDPAQIVMLVRQCVQQLDRGDGVLVLTDVYGATPSNIASRVLQAGRVEGIAGVSLPMLVRALTYRNEPLRTVVAKAMSGGVEGVFKMPAAIANATTES